MQSLSEELLFGVIWYQKTEGIIYEAWRKGWIALISESQNNPNILQDFNLALNKSFINAQNIIIKECKDTLIKNSVSSRYRGIISYKPIENDKYIRQLDDKLNLLKKQIKEINKSIRTHSKINLEKRKNIQELYKSKFQSSEKADEYRQIILEKAREDCDIPIYNSSLINREKNLYKTIYNWFLKEIEQNYQLSHTFNIYLLKQSSNSYSNTCSRNTAHNNILPNQSVTLPLKSEYRNQFTPKNYTENLDSKELSFTFALENSFLEAQKKIADYSRNELIKISGIAQIYRGVITYKPPGNDKDIKTLETKIEILNKQLKQLELQKVNLVNSELRMFSLEKFIELYIPVNSSPSKSNDSLEKIYGYAEINCDVDIYKDMLRDKEYGLFPEAYKHFYQLKN